MSRAGSGERVRPGHAIDIRVASTGDISVAPEFIVQYVKTQKTVVPGDVHATATFTIDYQ